MSAVNVRGYLLDVIDQCAITSSLHGDCGNCLEGFICPEVQLAQNLAAGAVEQLEAWKPRYDAASEHLGSAAMHVATLMQNLDEDSDDWFQASCAQEHIEALIASLPEPSEVSQ